MGAVVDREIKFAEMRERMAAKGIRGRSSGRPKKIRKSMRGTAIASRLLDGIQAEKEIKWVKRQTVKLRPAPEHAPHIWVRRMWVVKTVFVGPIPESCHA